MKQTAASRKYAYGSLLFGIFGGLCLIFGLSAGALALFVSIISMLLSYSSDVRTDNEKNYEDDEY